MTDWGLTILAPLLVILKVTIIFACALLADSFILIVISWAFGGIISHNSFAANILEGIQILSALGTAVAYILYLFRSLIKPRHGCFTNPCSETDRWPLKDARRGFGVSLTCLATLQVVETEYTGSVFAVVFGEHNQGAV